MIRRRMFVAVDLDDNVKAALRSVAVKAKQTAKEGALKFANLNQAHLTLVFLGDVEAPRTDGIIAAMQTPIAGARPFQMSFGGLGIFPSHGAPRVLWLGVSAGEREVIALQRIVARRIEALGVTQEDRVFHPHLTLGRWRQSRPSDRPVLPASGPPTPEVTVDHVTLYESRLSSEGPAHIERARALLT